MRTDITGRDEVKTYVCRDCGKRFPVFESSGCMPMPRLFGAEARRCPKCGSSDTRERSFFEAVDDAISLLTGRKNV